MEISTVVSERYATVVAESFDISIPPLSVLITGRAACDVGWSGFGNSCYKLFDQAVQFTRATDLCQNETARLVEIQSQSENSFVTSLVTSVASAWIGYNDITWEGHWTWINTGKGGNFSNWAPGNPNSSGDCAKIEKTQWDDVPCSSLQPFVCEKGNCLMNVC